MAKPSLDRRLQGLALVREMFDAPVATALDRAGSSGAFGAGLGDLALENVFAALWTRPGLDRRSRSLLTLGILIALNAGEELAIHVVTAHRNGVSVEELEEVIYHASGYAGFPLASAARATAARALEAAGIERTGDA